MIRRPRLFPTIFVTWMVCEILAFAIVVHLIGFIGAFLLGLGATLVGIGILRKLGRGAVRNVRHTLQGGPLPDGSMLDGLLTALGAILLILPGFLSDICGLALAAPSARQWLARRFGSARGTTKTGVIDLSPEDWSTSAQPEGFGGQRLDIANASKS